MTDHKAEAEKLIEIAGHENDPLVNGALMRYAQVHATLALVEQQRIANLVDFVGSLEKVTPASLLAESVVAEILDEIAELLGIEKFVTRAAGID